MAEENKSKDKEINIEELKKPAPEGRGSLNEIERQLEECEKQKAEFLAGWQRARADFLNYKKEEMERIGELIGYSKEEMVLKILPILDNFDLATRQNLSSENLGGQEKNNQVIQGFLQIKTQIQDFLKSQGVEEIKSVGEKLDLNFHEAIETVETKDKESGTIIEEIQKGYKINGRLLRPAKVRVIK